jgi:hypothetical protein
MYQLECNNCSCASAKPNVFSHVTLLLDKRRISRLSSRDNGASRCLHVKQISCPHTSLHTLLIERAPPQREHGLRWRHPCDPLCLPIPRSHSMHIGRRLPLCSPRIGLGPPPPDVGRGSGLRSPTVERASGSSSAAPTAERASGSSSAALAAGRASSSSSAAPTAGVEVFSAWIHRAAGLGSGEVTVLVNPNPIYVFALIECDLCDYD